MTSKVNGRTLDNPNIKLDARFDSSVVHPRGSLTSHLITTHIIPTITSSYREKNKRIMEDLERELGAMREYHSSGNTRDASWRRAQLRGLLLLLRDNQAEIFNALRLDLGKHPAEAYRDEVRTRT